VIDLQEERLQELLKRRPTPQDEIAVNALKESFRGLAFQQKRRSNYPGLAAAVMAMLITLLGLGAFAYVNLELRASHLRHVTAPTPKPTELPSPEPPPSATQSPDPCPAERPAADLWGASTAYDAARNVVVLFGGGISSTHLDSNATWTFRSCWIAMQPATSPPARSGAVAVYDPTRKAVILYGGQSRGTPRFLADTWMWDGTSWKDVTSSPSPNVLVPTAAFDPTANAVVALGASGISNSMEMWSWNGSWHQLHPKALPPLNHSLSTTIAFDPVARRLIAFDGLSSSDGGFVTATWAWDGITWSKLQPTHNPPPRNYPFLIDSGSSGLLLVGGSAVQSLTDVWDWDGNDWRQLQPATSFPVGGAVMSAVATPDGPLVLYTVDFYSVGDELEDLQIWRWRNGDWRYETTVSSRHRPPIYLGAIVNARDYAGIRTLPPPAGTTAGVDWSTLYPANCKTIWACAPGSPTIQLAAYTDVTQSVPNALAWVFTWNNAPCADASGAPPPPNFTPVPRPLPAPRSTCVWTIVADANSGREIVTNIGLPGY
jgi:hypothetical protein